MRCEASRSRNSSAGSGREKKKPWISSHSSAFSMSTCRWSSTPSATTRRRRRWAIAIMAEVMAASSGSLSAPAMNDWSTFSVSSGKRFR